MIFFIFGMTCITQSDLSGPGFPINRPTVCGTGAGAGVDSAWEQEKLEARKMPENGAESHLSGAPHQDGGRSFFPKETPQRRWIDKVYSEMAGLEAVQSIGDTHSRSPAVHLGRLSN